MSEWVSWEIAKMKQNITNQNKMMIIININFAKFAQFNRIPLKSLPFRALERRVGSLGPAKSNRSVGGTGIR